MPCQPSRCESSRPAGPAPMMTTRVRHLTHSQSEPRLRPRLVNALLSGGWARRRTQSRSRRAQPSETSPRERGHRVAASADPARLTMARWVCRTYLRDPAGRTLDYPAYRSSIARAPRFAPVELPQRLTEVTGPLFGLERAGPLDHDLTRQHTGEPIGQRIIVHGRVLDANERPVRRTLLEIWQANAAGRYRHRVDRWPAPSANYTGVGRADHRRARPLPVRHRSSPGAYPWGNHANAWRPAHIHFSLFGRSFTQRLVTQMYFPDDPLFGQDPIFGSVPDPAARQRLVSQFDPAATQPSFALAFAFDIVLRGSDITPFGGRETATRDDDDEAFPQRRPRRSRHVDAVAHVGPDLSSGWTWRARRVGDGPLRHAGRVLDSAARSIDELATPVDAEAAWSRPGRPTPTGVSPIRTTLEAIPERRRSRIPGSVG